MSVFRWTFIAVAGAKVPPLFSYTSLFTKFFYSFFKLFPNSLITDSLQIIFFQQYVRVFSITLPFLYFFIFYLLLFCRVFNLKGTFLKRNQSLEAPLLPFLIPTSIVFLLWFHFSWYFLLETRNQAPIEAKDWNG